MAIGRLLRRAVPAAIYVGAALTSACTTPAKTPTRPPSNAGDWYRVNYALFAADVEDATRACVRAEPSNLPDAWPIALQMTFDADGERIAGVLARSESGPLPEDPVVGATPLGACMARRLIGVSFRSLVRPKTSEHWQLVIVRFKAPTRGEPQFQTHRAAMQYVLDATNRMCGSSATKVPFVVSFEFKDGVLVKHRHEAGPRPSAEGLRCLEDAVTSLDLSAFAKGRPSAKLWVPFFLSEPLYAFPVD